jgi:choline-sulfatase
MVLSMRKLGAVFACLAAVVLSCKPEPPKTNLLLITLDTTRRDHLGVYGYARPTTPALDRFASRARVYTAALSTSSWTLPAHASLFTGLLPSSHGANWNPEGPLGLADALENGENSRAYRANPLGPDVPTLAEILSDAGYRTGAVVSGAWLAHIFGLGRGFEHYDDEGTRKLDGGLGDRVTERALAWLAEKDERPFFLFLNYFDPHMPYTDPDGYRLRYLKEIGPTTDRQARTRAAYDGEINFMDVQLGTLFDRMEEQGLFENTLVVVTADHGELIGEHGLYGHNRFLYEELLRIPLLVRMPGATASERIDTPVQLTDVFAMILSMLQLPVPEGIQGRADPRQRGPIFAEVQPLAFQVASGPRYAIFDGDYKLVSTAKETQLFNVANDPGESRDLAAAEPERAAAMKASLEAMLRSLPRPKVDRNRSVKPVDEETQRALKGLGYVE